VTGGEDLEERADAHQRRLSALSRAGGPLNPASPAATTNNPAWFDRRAGLRPLPARRRLHRQLLEAWRARRPAVRTDRHAILLAGPPGAGKSTVLAAVIAATGTAADEWRIINSDDFKDQLLEQARRDGSYDSWLLQGQLAERQAPDERVWPRELAALVHQEAGLLVSRATRSALASGENVVIDGTLSDAPRAHELLERLIAAGYSVRLVDVEASHEAVQARVAARWRADYVAAEAGTRADPTVAAPRALDEDGQRRLLRAAEAAPVRARALVMLMLFTALRISETVALDVDDVRITARKGLLVVLGKGELRREVPLNALVRQVLDEWLEHRKTVAADGERALWVSRAGGRLSARSADRDVRAIAARAGLELSAHTLRHTCLTGLVRRGNDLVMVAELAGHQKLETTRRYTLPSAADRQRAVDDLQIDY
jgi:integrase